MRKETSQTIIMIFSIVLAALGAVAAKLLDK
jgi:hypothetical protein